MGGNTGPQGPPAPRSHRGGRWALFAEVPGFGRFWAARATSAFGTGTAAVALLWLVSAGQAPGLDVGAVAAAELAAPSVLVNGQFTRPTGGQVKRPTPGVSWGTTSFLPRAGRRDEPRGEPVGEPQG